jgi:hypothetical protein
MRGVRHVETQADAPLAGRREGREEMRGVRHVETQADAPLAGRREGREEMRGVRHVETQADAPLACSVDRTDDVCLRLLRARLLTRMLC